MVKDNSGVWLQPALAAPSEPEAGAQPSAEVPTQVNLPERE